jgi:hypothetical protein
MTRDGRRLSPRDSHASGLAASIALKEDFNGTIEPTVLLSLI